MDLDETAINRAYADCLRSKGWAAVIQDDGGVLTEHSDDQLPAYELASLECQDEIVAAGLVPHPDRRSSEELIRYFYNEAIAYHGCLERLGYPTADPPTWETYLATFGSESERWVANQAVYDAAVLTGNMRLLEDASRDCASES